MSVRAVDYICTLVLFCPSLAGVPTICLTAVAQRSQPLTQVGNPILTERIVDEIAHFKRIRRDVERFLDVFVWAKVNVLEVIHRANTLVGVVGSHDHVLAVRSSGGIPTGGTPRPEFKQRRRAPYLTPHQTVHAFK